MSKEILEANERAMERYRKAVTVELTAEDNIHVSLDGVHTVNDYAAFIKAVQVIIGRSNIIKEAMGVLDAEHKD